MKTTKKSLLSSATYLQSLALVGGAAALLSSTAAFAQDAAEEDAASADQTIVVTGSLIRNPNLSASAPVATIGAQELELRQSNNAEEVLRTLPGAVPSIGSSVNNGNGGSSYVNLRGLGSNRNIVLLDGNRIVPADLVGRVDLNNIPLALVQRTDVLTGGASSTYGADAISGVVNFITKQDFAGMEATVSEQITQRGDGNVFRADLTMGANFDDGRGNAVLSLGYQNQKEVYFGGDRPFSTLTLESYDEFFVAGQGSSTTSPSRFDIGGGRTPQQVSRDGTGLSNYYQAFNFNPYNVFQTPFERFNMYGQARYEVADNIEVYARGMYSNNTVETIIAPSGVFGSAVTVPVSNPFMTAAQRAYLCSNADTNPGVSGNQTLTAAECSAASTASKFLANGAANPDYREFTFGLRRRTTETGPRISNYNSQVFDFRAGVRGNITDAIQFDVSASHGESKKLQTIQNYVLLSRVRQALLATSTGACQNTANGCVPLNIFGPDGSITSAMSDFISDAATVQENTKLDQVKAIISGDTGISSPWAAEGINFAAGAEYRRYAAQQSSDVLAKTPGELGGAGGAAPDINGGYEVYEGFGELILPIASDMPGIHELTVEAGIRQSHYKIAAAGNPTFDTTTWKVAGTWAPVPDFKVRGNYQRAVRAPNIGELFSPVSTGLTNLGTDPCQGLAPLSSADLRAVCIAQGAPADVIGTIQAPTAGQANITSGGNPNVGPETATTWSAGLVFTPAFLPGFSGSIDYYNIKVKSAITTPTPGDLIAACFDNLSAASATSSACTSIRRNPITGGLDGDPATTGGLFGVLSNLGALETSGVDLNLAYSTSIGTVFGQEGRLSFSFNGNYTAASKFNANAVADPSDDAFRECVNQYSVNCGSIQPKFSFSQRSTLGLGPVDVSLLWRWVNKVRFEDAQLESDLEAATDAGCTDPAGTDPDGCMVDPRFRTIKAYSWFDLTTRFEVSKNFDLTMSVFNLFDKKPPVVGGTVGSTSYNGGNTYPSSYDALGRRFAVSARLKF
ncbi:TonB-dependent receptor domain-containing protein [Novosphingobium arvoryzae]|uniref:TonB-dependent receptor n=1 Tax=Novosphingobium arvoryzae TaxID=1256514 RepID=A0A918VC03_9SPHN|nr:TonB-dependent receptor [Novosphingobium arvoryzae]GGZ86644.1 TonB-dependent receptor [Novosphingobium arvoryzae]